MVGFALHQARALSREGGRDFREASHGNRRCAAGRRRRLVRQRHVRDRLYGRSVSRGRGFGVAIDRRGDAVRIRQAVDGGAPANGRGVDHQPVEFPVRALVAWLCVSARGRQHHRAEAVGGDALLRRSAVRRSVQGGGPAGRRVQCRDLLARQCAGGRRRTDRASLREGHLLHRIDRGRPADRRQGRRASEEVLRRTRRQGFADRVRGRRHGARHAGGEFRLVHASGPDLHVGREGAGAREDFRSIPEALRRACETAQGRRSDQEQGTHHRPADQ